MHKDLSAILRLQTEHNQILLNIVNSLESAEELVDQLSSAKDSGPDTDKVREYEEYMTDIFRNINKHIRFEEQEVLPTIITYAEEIILRGMLYEHKEISQAITELREKGSDLISAYLEDKLLVADSEGILVRLQDMHAMLEEHIIKPAIISRHSYPEKDRIGYGRN